MTKTCAWLAVLGVALAFAAGAGFHTLLAHDHCTNYSYVSPDFACSPAVPHAWYVGLRASLDGYAAQAIKGDVLEVAVYYRDLREGTSVGVNATSDFAPASLLKLPVVLAILSIAESDPDILKRVVVYDKLALDEEFDIPTAINFDNTGNTLEDTKSYPVEDLLRATLVYSDNYAYFALLKFINYEYPGGTQEVGRALQELGVIDPRAPSEETVSVRNYSGIFRILYNAAFLDVDNSEKVLHWLVEATFKDGIVAGVPSSVPVATKFGERALDGAVDQLHDCGVVYHPQSPYTLCVMTKGNDWASLKKTISEISALVYKEVDSRAR